jgi:hypothetical protein
MVASQVPKKGKEVTQMASFVLVVALVAFLAGAATAVFLMLFISIRRGDCPERIQASRLDTCTRKVLGSGTWPNVPVYRNDREGN